MTENIRKNQCDKILEYMYDHVSGISNTEAVTKLHIGRLSGRIKDLRDDGWDIVTTMVKGENSRYARYTFSKRQKERLCKCEDCSTIYEYDECEVEKWRDGDKILVYMECPKCGNVMCVDEYESIRPYGEQYGTNIWAGREI